MINKCFLKERLEKGEMYILGQNKVELKPKTAGGGGAVTRIPKQNTKIPKPQELEEQL